MLFVSKHIKNDPVCQSASGSAYSLSYILQQNIQISHTDDAEKVVWFTSKEFMKVNAYQK